MAIHLQKKICTLFILSFLVGCSQKAAITGETLKQALFGTADISVDPQHIRALPYASSYVKINNTTRIFMVLAFADKNPNTGNIQLKWMSEDNAMIVTENGRIIKTLNLSQHNIASITPRFSLFDFGSNNQQWSAVYDWQPNYDFDHLAQINSHHTGQQRVQSTLWDKNLDVWQEEVVFAQSSQHMTNHFWTDEQGQVLKSQQWLIPDQLYIEQEILKPYAQ